MRQIVVHKKNEKGKKEKIKNYSFTYLFVYFTTL